MEEEKERQQYINSTLIEKGYNPEQLSNFITRIKGTDINSISFEELKILIEQFKNEELSKTILSVNLKKDNNNLFNLYSPCEYNIETAIQQESEMLKLEREKKKINVIINEPKIESSGFFTQKIYSFVISSEELNSKVKRTYNDFEWFKNQLNQRYPFILVPPIMKESIFNKISFNTLNTLNSLNVFKRKNSNSENNENELLECKTRYLNKFINAVLRKKILRTSPLTLEFLKLEEKDFEQYKKGLNNKPFDLKITMSNFKTIKGKINIILDEKKINEVNNIPKKLLVTEDLYSKLKISFDNIINDFNLISNHMKELSEIFDKLKIQSKEENYSKEIQNLYKNLKSVFNSWSTSYLNQSKFFKDDFWEFFNYNLLEYYEFDTINKQYLNYKNDYESFGNKLNNKKEILFKNQDFSKWEVEKGMENEIQLFKHDKKASFNLMCFKESKYVEAQKKIVSTAINYLIQQFNKLNKYQGERAKIYFDGLKERNQIITADAFNLIQLFSVKTN